MISRKAAFVEAVLASTLLLGSGILIARAQDSSADSAASPSLGDAARKARAQKKDSGKPAKVFTNEDVGGLKGTISVIGNEPAPASSTDKSGEKTDDGKKTDDKKAAAADSKDTKKEAAKEGSKDEGYWRAKFAAARKTLADDSKELDILQREYNLKLEQYSQDPNWAMHQQYSRDDINKTQSEIDAKKQDVEKDKQALSDLQDELRKSGGEPGWANEPSSGGSGSFN